MPPFDPLNTRAAELRTQGHDVVSLGQALPFFGPPDAALRAAREALDDPAIHVYATDPGLPSLRAALADRLSAEVGQPISADDLLITAGANHAFAIVAATLLTPGDEVVVPAPYFTNHHMTLTALGAVPIEAPILDQTTFDVTWSDLAPYVGERTRAVVLCNPSNPTGAAVGAAGGSTIVGELASRGIAVISDETYMALVLDGPHWSAASAPSWRDHVVVVGSFSKAFGMMGWRVGFVLADAALCREVVKVQDAMIICAPVISQMVAEAAVRESWTYARSFHQDLRRRRQILTDALAGIAGVHWLPGRGGLFGFARLDGCRDSTALARILLEESHVVTIPGAAFGPSGEGHLRLSYGRADEVQLARAATRLAHHLRSSV